MISCAQIVVVTARLNASTSKTPSSSRNLSRFSDARLHAELSTCMYSLQGLLALIRPVLGQVCQSLMVVSYCIPGSPQAHAAADILRSSSFASTTSAAPLPTIERSSHGLPSTAACMKSSVTRTLLLAFWNWMLLQASPLSDMSQPASPSA